MKYSSMRHCHEKYSGATMLTTNYNYRAAASEEVSPPTQDRT